MIATLWHSSSVSKPGRTAWHLFNACHLMVTMLAAWPNCAADISYCSTRLDEISQCVLTSPLHWWTHQPPLSSQWHHTSMWRRLKRKALLRFCRTQRGDESCLCEERRHVTWAKDQVVFDVSGAADSVVLIICSVLKVIAHQLIVAILNQDCWCTACRTGKFQSSHKHLASYYRMEMLRKDI